MFSNGTAEISLDLPCRTVCAVRADRIHSRFLVGSSCATAGSNNSVHVVRFHQERNDHVHVDAKLLHDGPVAAICSSPDDPTLVCTASASSCTLFLHKIPEHVMHASDDDEDEDDEQGAVPTTTDSTSMEQLWQIETKGAVADLCWSDDNDNDDDSMIADSTTGSSKKGELLFVTRSGHLTQFDLQSHQWIRTIPFESSQSLLAAGCCPRIQWDPHANGNAVAVTTGKRVHLLDWRVDTSIPTGTVDSFVAHQLGVTALDYNPNKPYILATAGQDALVKFWDLRLTNRPLLVARGGCVCFVVLFCLFFCLV